MGRLVGACGRQHPWRPNGVSPKQSCIQDEALDQQPALIMHSAMKTTTFFIHISVVSLTVSHPSLFRTCRTAFDRRHPRSVGVNGRYAMVCIFCQCQWRLIPQDMMHDASLIVSHTLNFLHIWCPECAPPSTTLTFQLIDH